MNPIMVQSCRLCCAVGEKGEKALGKRVRKDQFLTKFVKGRIKIWTIRARAQTHFRNMLGPADVQRIPVPWFTLSLSPFLSGRNVMHGDQVRDAYAGLPWQTNFIYNPFTYVCDRSRDRAYRFRCTYVLWALMNKIAHTVAISGFVKRNARAYYRAFDHAERSQTRYAICDDEGTVCRKRDSERNATDLMAFNRTSSQVELHAIKYFL